MLKKYEKKQITWEGEKFFYYIFEFSEMDDFF